jgi:D-sedoheptulose 7-phosphate isomerase
VQPEIADFLNFRAIIDASVTVANGSDDGLSPAPVAAAVGVAPHAATYLAEAAEILARLDVDAIEAVVEHLVRVRESGGRLFFVGCGGGAGHASHAVNDFRKLAGFEAYTPSDNVSELTARVNDEGWEGAYAEWLRTSRLSGNDLLFVLSVGGGDAERNVSANLVRCLDLAREVGATVCGVVGRDGGYTARVADACVVVPVVNPATVTPHTEAFQAVVWHLLVSHPALQKNAAKWESVA